MGKEFRHLRVLREQLGNHTDAKTQTAVLSGLDGIKDSASPHAKAEWACVVTARLDTLLDEETHIKVREHCACLFSNEKSIYAKEFRRLRKQFADNAEYLHAAIYYLNATAPLKRCGDVSLDGDKIITVIARGRCECQVLKNGLKTPISVTWCHCCKGSILSVIKYIFPERKCKMIIKETIVSGGGMCLFVTIFESEDS
ncbi:MAG TPA: hypothetical protein DEP23_09555 [Ruminococcaceae bacterium]|nr:hypothetical protein [Oscillospiraceae bacterium]